MSSIKDIDWKQTTVENDQFGNVWYKNPAINIDISTQGVAYNKTTGKKQKATKDGKINFRFTSDGGNYPARVSTIMTYLLGVCKDKPNNKVLLKNENEGWVEGNILVYKEGQHKVKATVKFFEANKEQTKQPPKQLVGTKDTNHETLYTISVNNSKYITEDFAEFPTKELADWHQDNVSKGKGNAQVVLDYNGGYVLAEQIFLQEVQYNVKKPYVNFVDVMNNNDGVTHTPSESYAKFDKKPLSRFGIDKVTEYNEEEAKSIERVVHSILALEDKLSKLI